MVRASSILVEEIVLRLVHSRTHHGRLSNVIVWCQFVTDGANLLALLACGINAYILKSAS